MAKRIELRPLMEDEQTYLDKLARRLGLNDADVADMNASMNR